MAATTDGSSVRRQITVSPTARTVLTVAGIVGLIYVCWLLRDVLLLAILAVFLAVALSAPVNFFQNRARMPRALAILVVYALLAGAMTIVALLVLPPLIREFTAFLHAVPGYVPFTHDGASRRAPDRAPSGMSPASSLSSDSSGAGAPHLLGG